MVNRRGGNIHRRNDNYSMNINGVGVCDGHIFTAKEARYRDCAS
jgi:hypothetical protein